MNLFLFVTALSYVHNVLEYPLVAGLHSMIDTIVLTLSWDMYSIIDPDKFNPSARWALSAAALSNHLVTSKSKARFHQEHRAPESIHGSAILTMPWLQPLLLLLYCIGFKEGC